MKFVVRFIVAAKAALLCCVILFPGCSGPQEDVRLTYCKDLVKVRLDASQGIEWKGSESEIRRPEYAQITLNFDAAQGDGAHVPMQAACYYRYDTGDENAMTHSTPLSAYATVPYRMTVNGKEVGERALHEAIKSAALQQGTELMQRIRKEVGDATQQVRREPQ